MLDIQVDQRWSCRLAKESWNHKSMAMKRVKFPHLDQRASELQIHGGGALKHFLWGLLSQPNFDHTLKNIPDPETATNATDGTILVPL